MRPDVAELIAGACRILEEVVDPALAEPYPREVLQGVVQTLRALQDGWARVLPFLLWDNAAMNGLLARVAEHAPSPTSAGIRALLDTPEPDPTDAIAVQARNQALRALCARVLADDDETMLAALEPVTDDILLHLEERARRTPIKLVPEIPRSAPAKDA